MNIPPDEDLTDAEIQKLYVVYRNTRASFLEGARSVDTTGDEATLELAADAFAQAFVEDLVRATRTEQGLPAPTLH